MRVKRERKRIIHLRSIRMFNNAGMSFPECYASHPMLDLQRSSLPVSPDVSQVTCKRCRKLAGV